MVHASQGVLAPAVAALLQRARDRRRPGARRARRAHRVPLGGAGRGLRPHPRRIERVVPGFEDFNARVRTPGGFRPAEPRARARASPRRRARALHRAPAARAARSRPGELPADDHPQPRPVQHHDLRPRRPLPRHPRRRARRVHERGRHRARPALAAGDRVDLASRSARRERALRASPWSPTPIPRGCAAAYFPEANPLVAAGRLRRRQPHAGVEVDPGAVGEKQRLTSNRRRTTSSSGIA